MKQRWVQWRRGRTSIVFALLLLVSAVGVLPAGAQTPIPGAMPTAGAPVGATQMPMLPPPNAQFIPQLAGKPLLDAVRQGGYVIYLRHGATDQSRQDNNVDVNNCDTQRMLSDAGRQDARVIGQSFRTLSIPVGKVLSSEYCRTKETATLAFDRFELEPALTFTKEDRANYLRLLSTPPAPGTNTVLVGHIPGISSAVGLALDEGEAGIFDPKEPNNPRFVARVRANEWIKLLPSTLPPADGQFNALLSGQPLLDALKHGGYVIYFRHAATDYNTSDNSVSLADCKTQRNLSDMGRADARIVAQGFRTLGIPVGRVGVSEYCRTRETAQLAFGRSQDEPALTLNSEQRDLYIRLLTAPPTPGTNTVLVGHVPGISAATGLALNEGEAGIFDPTELGNPRFVARVAPADWIKLVPPVTAGSTQFMPLLAGRPLVDALRQGGYVIYFRHAVTDQARQDMLPIPDYNDCSTQRLLSDNGRADSRLIGQQLTALNIPIGKVFASEFCRTREMSTLMFGRFELEPALTYTKEMNSNYYRLLTAPPMGGTNTVLVGHVPGISAAVGLALNEGEAAVFDPTDPNNPRFVARIMPADWAKLLSP